jgi:hypothetical protein
MTTKELRAELLEAVTVLKMLDCGEDARALHLDIVRAGHDLRELLMVREDAERLLEGAALG